MTQIPRTQNRVVTPILTGALIVFSVPVLLHFSALAFEVVSAEVWTKGVATTCMIVVSVLIGIIPGRLASGARDGYYRFLKILLTVLMGLLIVPVTMQILSRYTGLIPRYIWTEEIARFCFIWIVMVGAMIAAEDDSHFDVDLLPTPTTLRGKGFSKLVVHGSMMLIAVNFIIFGYDFSETAWYQISEISELPMILIYIAWPLAGVTWTIFLSTKIYEDIQRIMGIEPWSDQMQQASEPTIQPKEAL